MQFAREIQRIFLATLIAFGLVGLSAGYWAVIGQNSILLREDNPRIIEDIARIQRGAIYDRDGEILAETVRTNNTTTRTYYHDSTYSVLGYYSLRYGEGGTESAFNDILTGPSDINTLEDYFEQGVLKTPPIGTDIQLTLDLDIQNKLVELMAGYQGAGVILNAQTGDILSLVSLPTIDPNTLDENWDTLTQAEGNPFFNRVLQGQYQPGSIIYTLWMAQALLTKYDATQLIANASDSISLGEETTVDCMLEPNTDNISLRESYYWGCPVPFAVYSRTSKNRSFENLVKTFALDNQITLADFAIPEPISASNETQADIDSTLIELRNTLGQGNITVTPLHIAEILSAITNNGNALQPNIISHIQTPETGTWQSVIGAKTSVPMMTALTARQLRTLMRDTWQTLQSDTYSENIIVGASLAQSQSGDETQIWLIGFVRHDQAGQVAFVVLLEDTSDIEKIITMGQEIIPVIINNLNSP